jgi:hypothetical protein
VAGGLGHVLWRRMGSAVLVPHGWRLRSVAALQVATVSVLLDEPLDFAENTPLQQVLAVLVVGVLLVFARRQRGTDTGQSGGF